VVYKTPLYNRTKKNDAELWVCLLEKAWAKIFNGYKNIEGGFMEEALRDLTGASCRSYYTNLKNNTDDFLWQTICEAE